MSIGAVNLSLLQLDKTCHMCVSSLLDQHFSCMKQGHITSTRPKVGKKNTENLLQGIPSGLLNYSEGLAGSCAVEMKTWEP